MVSPENTLNALMFVATVLLYPIRYLEEALQVVLDNHKNSMLNDILNTAGIRTTKEAPISFLAEAVSATHHDAYLENFTSNSDYTDEVSFRTFLSKTTRYHKKTCYY